MRRNRRWIGPSLGALALVLSACNWRYVEPQEVAVDFGEDGVVTVEAPTSSVVAGTTHDGGILAYVVGSSSLLRYGPDGQPDPGWTPPVITSQVQVAQGLSNGTVTVVTWESGALTIRRYAADGTRLDAGDVVSPGPVARPAISPSGLVTTARSNCTVEHGCDSIEVRAYAHNGSLRWATTVPMDVTDQNCGTSIVTAYAAPLDSGSVMVGQVRCSAELGTQSSASVIRRLTADGDIDETYGDGAGYGVLTSTGNRIVVSQTGHVLASSGSFQIRRLDPDGRDDTTFGVHTTTSYLSGRLPSDLVPNATGYTITSSTPAGDNPCSPSEPGIVVNIDHRGVVTSSVAIPAAIGGSLRVLRHHDGSQVVYGVHQAFTQTPTSTTCTTPRTYRFLKLIVGTYTAF